MAKRGLLMCRGSAPTVRGRGGCNCRRFSMLGRAGTLVRQISVAYAGQVQGRLRRAGACGVRCDGRSGIWLRAASAEGETGWCQAGYSPVDTFSFPCRCGDAKSPGAAGGREAGIYIGGPQGGAFGHLSVPIVRKQPVCPSNAGWTDPDVQHSCRQLARAAVSERGTSGSWSTGSGRGHCKAPSDHKSTMSSLARFMFRRPAGQTTNTVWQVKQAKPAVPPFVCFAMVVLCGMAVRRRVTKKSAARGPACHPWQKPGDSGRSRSRRCVFDAHHGGRWSGWKPTMAHRSIAPLEIEKQRMGIFSARLWRGSWNR